MIQWNRRHHPRCPTYPGLPMTEYEICADCVYGDQPKWNAGGSLVWSCLDVEQMDKRFQMNTREAQEPVWCAGCGSRWRTPEGFLLLGVVHLCGDCWRKAQPVLHGAAREPLMKQKVPKELDNIVDSVLAYRPKARSKPAIQRKRRKTILDKKRAAEGK